MEIGLSYDIIFIVSTLFDLAFYCDCSTIKLPQYATTRIRRKHSIEMDFELSFRKSSQTYKISRRLQCTNLVELNVVITADACIDFRDVRLIGQKENNTYVTFSDLNLVAPIRLKPNQRDIITIIMGDKSFRKVDRCDLLYLAIKSYNYKYAREVTDYYAMSSTDWLDEKWTIRHITLDDVNDAKTFLKKIATHSAGNNIDSSTPNKTMPNETISQYYYFHPEELKTVNANMLAIRIVESELGKLANGTQCFFFLVELENTSDKDYSYNVSGLKLLDCENVNLTLVGYINKMSPSEAVIEKGTKDKFYIGFKTDKTQNLDGPLLLRLCIKINGYKEVIEEKIHFEQIAGEWQEISCSMKEKEPIDILQQKLKIAMHKFGEEEGLTFNNITADYHGDELRVRALVKRNLKINGCRFFSVVIFDDNNSIIATLDGSSSDSIGKWKLFDSLCSISLDRCNSVMLVNQF